MPLNKSPDDLFKQSIRDYIAKADLDQYEALPEDIRAEVFDGQIYYMASLSQEHQTISTELTTILNSYIKNKKCSCRVFHAPFDVKLSDSPLTIDDLYINFSDIAELLNI